MPAVLVAQGDAADVERLLFESRKREYGEVQLGVPGNEIHSLLKAVGGNQVVGIEENDIFARNVFQPDVAAGISAFRPLLRTSHQFDARVFRCIFGNDSFSRVRGTVVYDEQFPIGIGLRQDAVEHLSDERFCIVHRNDDTDRRGGNSVRDGHLSQRG